MTTHIEQVHQLIAQRPTPDQAFIFGVPIKEIIPLLSPEEIIKLIGIIYETGDTTGYLRGKAETGDQLSSSLRKAYGVDPVNLVSGVDLSQGSLADEIERDWETYPPYPPGLSEPGDDEP